MKKLITLFLFMLLFISAKYADLTPQTQDTLVQTDMMMVSSTNLALPSRSVNIGEYDLRWLQAPNDVGIGLEDLWSASKIIAELSVTGIPNDAGTGLDDLWSASKISDEITAGLATPTLQETYNASSTPEIVVDSTRRAFTIRDNLTPIATPLFEVESSDGTETYFSVDVDKTYLGHALKLDGITAPAQEEGLLFYDTTDKSLVFYNNLLNTSLPIGEQVRARVINATGTPLLKGKVVAVSGASGGYPSMALANASTLGAASFMGVVLEDIPDASHGYVASVGKIKNLDTSPFLQGDILYLSDTIDGGVTTTKPSYPSALIVVGQVVVSDASNGIIMTRMTRQFSNFQPTSLFFADANGSPANDVDNLSYDYTANILNSDFISVLEGSSLALPSIHSASTRGTGINFPTSVQIDLVSNGASKLLISTSSITPKVSLFAQNGTTLLPTYSFAGMTNGGIYRSSGDNTLRMSIEGLDKQIWSETGVEIGNIAGGKTLSINEDGVASAYGSYGEMKETNESGSIITVVAAGTYYGWTTASAGLNAGADYISFLEDATADRLVIGANGGGIYKISGSISFTGSNSQEVRGAIFKNGLQEDILFRRGLGTSPPSGSASLQGLISVAPGDYIDFRGTSDINGGTITIYAINLNLTRISK